MTTKRKTLTIICSVLLAVFVAYMVMAFVPKKANHQGENPMMTKTELPILIAHGGGNKEFPDNTLEAFYNAYSVDENVMMETDVSITKDGVVILSHDTTIDRKTNQTGSIADWNYSDLIAQEVDFSYTNPTSNQQLNGERVKFTNKAGVQVTPLDVQYPQGVSPRHTSVFLATTLEELIVAFPNNRINVEIKQEGAKGVEAFYAIVDLLEKHDAFDRVVLASFHDDLYNLYQEKQNDGTLPSDFMCSPATDGVTKFVILHALQLDLFFNDKMTVFQLPMEQLGINLATKALVDKAHAHNLAVHYWTINDIEDMRYLISIGADGIMTDYPHLLQQVYNEYNQ